MITWIYGNSGAGKSTLAKRMKEEERQAADAEPWVILDGDVLRTIWTDLDLSEAGRREQNLRAARLAKLLDDQFVNVIVATICPYRDLREQVKAITGCRFIYLEGGKTGPEYPFEPPGDEREEAEAQTAAFLHDERSFS